MVREVKDIKIHEKILEQVGYDGPYLLLAWSDSAPGGIGYFLHIKGFVPPNTIEMIEIGDDKYRLEIRGGYDLVQK